MKYVIVADDEIPSVSLFDDSLVHMRMARAALRSLNGRGRLVGAGFVTLKGRPHGHSESLDLGPGPDDEQILRRFLGLPQPSRERIL